MRRETDRAAELGEAVSVLDGAKSTSALLISSSTTLACAPDVNALDLHRVTQTIEMLASIE